MILTKEMQELIEKEANKQAGKFSFEAFESGTQFILSNPKAFNLYTEAEAQELVDALEKSCMCKTAWSGSDCDYTNCSACFALEKFQKGRS